MLRCFPRLLLLMVAAVTPAFAAPPENFAARVESLRAQFGVPGMAVVIVEDGRIVHLHGYGVRKLGASAPVDPATIFPTGSTGKAFTAAALALLVEEERIAWDDRVIDHMPWFRMHDPFVTRELKIRDLLVHRSGLGMGAGDLLFVPRSNLSRRDTVKRLAHIEPASSFRSQFAYNNAMYMVAGQLIEEVTGQSWEDFVLERILRAGGMNHSTSHGEARFEVSNRAQPHARFNGGLRGLGDQTLLDERDELGRNGAPAGGLAMSAADLGTWLQVQLGLGALPDEDARLLSESSVREMWTPVVIRPVQPLPEAVREAQPTFDSYALGWSVRDYRGEQLIAHGGGVFGFITMVALMPQRGVGFAIVMNSEEVQLLRGLMFELLDHYLGVSGTDWVERWAALHEERLALGRQQLTENLAQPAGVGPSLPLERYAGRYADPWYGGITIEARANGLYIDFPSAPRMAGPLEHWQYETFVTRFEDATIEPAYVTFTLDAQGGVQQIQMQAVSPLADFSYDYRNLRFLPEGLD